MTELAPYAQLVDLVSNTVVAATTNVVSWEFGSILDNSPSGQVTVPLADAGDGTTSFSSFAELALSAAGGPALPDDPAPLALELSLSGPGGPVDFRWVGFTVERKVASGELVLEMAGEDAYGALYAAIPAGGGKTTMQDLSLSDALWGAQGTIAPLDPAEQNRLLSADGTIPYLYGLLRVSPGSPDWDAGARTRVTYTPVVPSAVADLPTYLDSLADTVVRAVAAVARRVGGAVISGDVPSGRPQGTRGHLVVDGSDAELNVSSVVG